jgi:hypothetical protein
MRKLSNNIQKVERNMKHFIFILVLIVSLGMVDELSAKQHYMLCMKGDTSIFVVMDVLIEIKNPNIIVTDIKTNKDFMVLQKREKNFTGSFEGYDGIYRLNLQENKKEFAGNFIFEPNEAGIKRFYLKDKGDCQLVPYNRKILDELKNDMDKFLYRMDCYKSIEEMEKHSPWARSYYAKRRKQINSRNVSIKFYGKVVDQFDKPVVNADVYLGIRFTPLIMWTNMDKNFHLTTNNKGEFYLSGKGDEVIIDKIEKSGRYPDFSILSIITSSPLPDK